MKKFIFTFVIMCMCVVSTYAGKKDTLAIHNLRVQNDSLKVRINELTPEEDGYQVVNLSPIEELALEVGTEEIRAFGVGTSSNEQLARNIAHAHATAALQKKIEQYVRYGLDQYNSTLGVNDQYTVDERTREQVVIACKNIVEGIAILKTRKLYNSKTHRYKYEMCVKYDRETILSTIEKQNARIRANEKEFEADMQEAWDALDEKHNPKVTAEIVTDSIETSK